MEAALAIRVNEALTGFARAIIGRRMRSGSFCRRERNKPESISRLVAIHRNLTI
jgi:hypothetical protein